MDDAIEQFTIRIPASAVRELDLRITEMRASNPGLRITRGVAARALLLMKLSEARR